MNCVHRTCIIESFSHPLLSAFIPLWPSASLLVQILYCVLLLGANTFPMFLQDSSQRQSGSCQVMWSVSLEHASMVIPCLMQLCALQPAPRLWLTSRYQKFILDSYPIYCGWYCFIEKSIWGRQ